MKFLCLIYADEKALAALREYRSLSDECLAYSAALDRQGICLATAALESVESATTLRVRDGRVSITDGPFAEAREQLAGFYLIEADGLHEALHLAADIPLARVGSIELRPVRSLPRAQCGEAASRGSRRVPEWLES